MTHVIDRWFLQVNSRLDQLLPGQALAKTPQAAEVAAGVTNPAAPVVVKKSRPVPKSRTVAKFDTAAEWKGWKHHQSVKMAAGGKVEIGQSNSTPGVQSDLFDLPETGLFKVVVECSFKEEKGSAHPHLRFKAEGQTQLGPDMPLENGRSEHYFFAPARTKKVQLMVITFNPKTGFAFDLKSVALSKVDEESFYESGKAVRTEPVIASMASIPKRRPMLRDCVNSLLLQCDTVRVFLNEYEDVPDFLDHPRVEIRRSQDWDDKGDAGKFGWIDEADEPGYRIIVDDDLLFPPDFARVICKTVADNDNRAIAAMHGVILRQPVTAYYDASCRSVFHFQNALTRDRTCHVLGTNALCYHSDAVKLRWADFMFRNMADIFLAQYARDNALPMIAIARRQYWVRQNDQEGGFETIYESSHKKNKSKFDSSLIQDALVKRSYPLTMQPTTRPKVALGIVASSVSEFEECFKSWAKSRWLDYDWALIVVAGTNDAALIEHVANIKTDHEVHVVADAGLSPLDRVAKMLNLAKEIGFACLCLLSDAARFKSGAWTRPALGLCQTSSPSPLFVLAPDDKQISVTGALNKTSPLPLFSVVPSRLFDAAPEFEPGAVQPLSALAGWLIKVSECAIQRVRLTDKVSTEIAASFECKNPGLLSSATATVDGGAGTRLAPAMWKDGASLSVNGFFERAFVINLDRREDRWKKVDARLKQAGIVAERFSAIDGRLPDVAAEYGEYAKRPLMPRPQVRPITSTLQFYQDYDSEAARVSYIEEKDKSKAIQSAGAWAYLKTWELILEKILREQIKTALVFDDDVQFHKDFQSVFAAAVGGLPDNWLILQLGTLQYDWGSAWVTKRSPFLYQTNGSAVGSHAVGISFDIAPFLLEHVKRMQLPFDTGALAMATRFFADRCFVVTPNLAVQALDDASDIGTSTFQKGSEREKAASTYRWNLAHYG
ncbi:glycosyltransferase family 25 protein [Rhizobium sp.]